MTTNLLNDLCEDWFPSFLLLLLVCFLCFLFPFLKNLGYRKHIIQGLRSLKRSQISSELLYVWSVWLLEPWLDYGALSLIHI